MRVGFGTYPFALKTARLARRIESLTFDALSLADSPNLTNDVYGELMVAALSTGKIELSTGVTNSLTRHASVTAASIATLQMESGGRAVCGIGRGNTAAYQIGMKPDGLDHFERYLVALKSYLRGEPVDSAGRQNRLEWLDVKMVPRVPLEVAVSGPKVLGIAARHADRISLAVGGDPVFVSMWLARAQAAVVAAGRDPSSVRYGAYVPVFVNDDLTVARQCVRFIAGTFANLLTMVGQIDDERLSALPRPLVEGALAMRDGYDLARGPASTAGNLPDGLLDWFAIAGPPQLAISRLVSLADIGLDYVFMVSGYHTLAPALADGSLEALGEQVLPALRSHATRR